MPLIALTIYMYESSTAGHGQSGGHQQLPWKHWDQFNWWRHWGWCRSLCPLLTHCPFRNMSLSTPVPQPVMVIFWWCAEILCLIPPLSFNECVCTALTTRHLQPHRQSLTLHFLLMYIPIDKGTKWNFPVHLHLISSSDSVWASFLCSVCWLIRQRGNLQRRAYLNWFAYLNVCVDRECE